MKNKLIKKYQDGNVINNMNENNYEVMNSRMMYSDNYTSHPFPYTSKLEEARKAADYLRRYLQSDGFKQRLENINNNHIKSLIGNSFFGVDDLKVEYGNVSDALESVEDVSGSFKLLDNAHYLNGSNKIQIGDINFNGFVNNGYDDVMAHEFTHALEKAFSVWYKTEYDDKWEKSTLSDYSQLFPIFKESNAYKRLLQEWQQTHPDTNPNMLFSRVMEHYGKNHDAMPTESYADLGQLRYELDKYGIYDSTLKDNPATQEHIDAYKKALQGKNLNRLFRNFTDEQIIEMLNTIAYNDNNNIFDMYDQPRNVLYAKNGTTITQYFKNGRKIHIKESQKGSFTRYCGGNVTSECIARGKASPDPRIRKKATFADNARKWKHQYGGSLNYEQNDVYDEDDNRIDYRNIAVDKEIFNPYGRFAFGLDDDYEPDKWYVGNKGSGDPVWNNHVDIVKAVYQQLQTAIRNTYNNYSAAQVNQLADWMTRHYIGENGWTPMNKVKNFGGFSGAKTIAGWVTGMKEWYPKSMSATNFRGYIEGLKSNKNGQRYNSVQPGDSYYNNLFKNFGPGTRVDRILKQINGTK